MKFAIILMKHWKIMSTFYQFNKASQGKFHRIINNIHLEQTVYHMLETWLFVSYTPIKKLIFLRNGRWLWQNHGKHIEITLGFRKLISSMKKQVKGNCLPKTAKTLKFWWESIHSLKSPLYRQKYILQHGASDKEVKEKCW